MCLAKRTAMQKTAVVSKQLNKTAWPKSAYWPHIVEVTYL